jgi:hypothetical protein
MVVRRAATRPGHLVAVAAALPAAASAVGFGWAVAIAAAIYLTLVGWRLSSPRFWQRALAEGVSFLPDPARLADPNLRESVIALKRARRDACGALEQLRGEGSPPLRALAPRLEALEQCAAKLIERGELVHRFLARSDRIRISAELRRIEDQLSRAEDSDLRVALQGALEARRAERRALDEVSRVSEWVMASLQRVLATVEGLPTRLLELELLDARAREDLSGELEDELVKVHEQLADDERALNEMGGRADLLPAPAAS